MRPCRPPAGARLQAHLTAPLPVARKSKPCPTSTASAYWQGFGPHFARFCSGTSPFVASHFGPPRFVLYVWTTTWCFWYHAQSPGLGYGVQDLKFPFVWLTASTQRPYILLYLQQHMHGIVGGTDTAYDTRTFFHDSIPIAIAIASVSCTDLDHPK